MKYFTFWETAENVQWEDGRPWGDEGGPRGTSQYSGAMGRILLKLIFSMIINK